MNGLEKHRIFFPVTQVWHVTQQKYETAMKSSDSSIINVC